MMQDLVDFLGKLFRKLWALLSCAAFTAIGLGGLHYNKSNAWVFKASLVVAGLCFVVACFQVWRDEHTTVTALQLDFPKIRIEPLRRTWLVEREGNQLLIQLFIHTRLTNVGRAETTIHSYVLRASGLTGDEYQCTLSTEMYNGIQSLTELVTREKPLKRGTHVEGWLRFDFIPRVPDPIDGKQRLNLNCELVVTDSFGKDYSAGTQRVQAPYDDRLGIKPAIDFW